MTTTSPPNLGNVITDPTARKTIYSIYVVALVAIGATQVAFAAISAGQPAWLTAAIAVGFYLGIPVGGLALSNTPKPAGNTHVAFPMADQPEQSASLPQ